MSVPVLVTKVNASSIVAAPPGARVALAGLVPLPRVVVMRIGVAETSTPVAL